MLPLPPGRSSRVFPFPRTALLGVGSRNGVRVVREAILDALAILSPIDCAGCGLDDRALCARCGESLRPHPAVRLLPGTPALVLVSALTYEGPVRRAILALKESGRTDLSRPLGAALLAAAAHATAELTGTVEIAVIPTSRAAFRRRGYDPVQLVLRRAGFPRSDRVIVPVRRTSQQKTLDRTARGANVALSLRAPRGLTGRRFLLVDDVATTGATLLEAARAIRVAGGEVVAAVTIAYTPLRSSARP